MCYTARISFLLTILSLLILTGCDERPWNDPYPKQSATSNTLYSAFSTVPQHLDPAKAFSSPEFVFIGQIYEPPLQYNYVKRPYELEPLTAVKMPTITYDKATNVTTYTIQIKPGIMYQPHKIFQNQPRELVAADYVLQVQRLTDPKVSSPVAGFLGPYLAGAEVIDKYTYAIKINGKYPQFKYWLAMSFFAPIPWEAIAQNINLDTDPVGTGAYYMTENNPNRRIVLTHNPNFHPEYYPNDGSEDAGKKLPLIDKIIFSLEKESIPYWDKFLQGYYDASGISADNFNTAISSASHGSIDLTQPLIDKDIRLRVSDTLSIWSWGFNMLDPVVGGYDKKHRDLRHAISLAFDIEEYIVIFFNGRATVADGVIPPEMFGYQPAQLAPVADRLAEAKKLLAAAGYPGGRDIKTGNQLQLNYEALSTGSPDENAQFGWFRKQFAKLGIDLIVQATDFNRFLDKMDTGNAQIFALGWSADYPDPENFLFLFYGPNGVQKSKGENITNYNNPEFDRLFDQFKAMSDTPQRLSLINQMQDLLRIDKPILTGIFPQSFALYHSWNRPNKPMAISGGILKYSKLDPILRAKQRLLWNQPLLWPFFVAVLIIAAIIMPAVVGYIRKENATGKKIR